MILCSLHSTNEKKTYMECTFSVTIMVQLKKSYYVPNKTLIKTSTCVFFNSTLTYFTCTPTFGHSIIVFFSIMLQLFSRTTSFYKSRIERVKGRGAPISKHHAQFCVPTFLFFLLCIFLYNCLVAKDVGGGL